MFSQRIWHILIDIAIFQAGYPDFKEIAAAQLDQTMAESSSYSQFLTAATQGKDFGDDQEAVNALIAAAEAAEEETGVLTEDNEEGLSMYSKAVAVSNLQIQTFQSNLFSNDLWSRRHTSVC